MLIFCIYGCFSLYTTIDVMQAYYKQKLYIVPIFHELATGQLSTFSIRLALFIGLAVTL